MDDQFRVTYNDGGFHQNKNQVGKTESNDKAKRDPSNNNKSSNHKPGSDGGAGSKNAAQLAEDAKNRTIGHYVVGRSLGSGTFGKVRIGTHTITGEKVAIKILEKDRIKDKGDVERVTREINILKKVRHPNVIQLYEIIETSRQLFLIMEYACGGELFDHIVKRKKLKEAEATKFFQQVISGVEYIHKCGICHRDLKPENLLLDESKNIKIVDFGLSNTYNENGLLKTACGSPCYAAPEMIAGKKYHGLASDIWSCGIILYAMTCGYLPFEDQNTNKLYKKILACDYTIPSSLSPNLKDLMKKILNTDPVKRITINDIRQHDWYTKIRSVEMDGVIVGKDRIPVISEFIDLLKEHFSGDNLEQATTFVLNNKHNQVTSTYYLLLKKKERVTGKNYVFEQVTFDKRKNLYSTSNLKGNFSRGLELGLNSTQKLFGPTYARSEGRAGGIPGSTDYKDIRSMGGSSANTVNNQNTGGAREDSIHKRVADIISLPSKAVPGASASQMNSSITHKLAMQTFNTDSIRPHLKQINNTNGQASAQNHEVQNQNHARAAQSHSPTQINRKNGSNEVQGGKNIQVGLKTHLNTMNQTFHGSGSKHANSLGPTQRQNVSLAAPSGLGTFQQRQGSLDANQVPTGNQPSRQMQYTADIHNGTMSLEDTIASNGFAPPNAASLGQKPDTSHTVGYGQPIGPHGSGGILSQTTRTSGQAIMAQTFTGKMFNMRNNSLRHGNQANQHGQINNLVNEKSGSVQIGNSKAQANVNLKNGGSNAQGSNGQNMNLLLTQFFPNNNYTARHQNLIGQKNMKKKLKSHELSPPRGQNHGKGVSVGASHSHNTSNIIDSSNLNLGNMKMRVINGHYQNSSSNGGQLQYLQSLNSTLDHANTLETTMNSSQYTNGGSGRQGNKGGHAQQTRRLMETSNMFNVYRNSLKNNQNNNSNASSSIEAAMAGQLASANQHFSEPQSKQGTAGLAGIAGLHQNMYATTQGGGGFFQQPNQRVHQRKTSELNGNLVQSGDLESLGGPPTANSIAPQMQDISKQQRGSQQPAALKVQDLLRNVNNNSVQSHMKNAHGSMPISQGADGGTKPSADFMSVQFNNQHVPGVGGRDPAHHIQKQGVASHLVQRSSGAQALGAHHPIQNAQHANSQSFRQQKDSTRGASISTPAHHNPALQNNFTAMTASQQTAMMSGVTNAFHRGANPTNSGSPVNVHGGGARGHQQHHDHRNTFYGAGGKNHGSGGQSLSVPRTSLTTQLQGGIAGGHHQRDASMNVNKRTGFSYF